MLVMVKSQPQLIFLPDEICTGIPVFVTFQPHCQPNTALANDLTAFVVPDQFQLLPQPIRSPCWQVDQIDCVPEPVPAPHQLLLIQYLPRMIVASRADAWFARALGEQARLLGSRQPPNRHMVPPAAGGAARAAVLAVGGEVGAGARAGGLAGRARAHARRRRSRLSRTCCCTCRSSRCWTGRPCRCRRSQPGRSRTGSRSASTSCRRGTWCRSCRSWSGCPSCRRTRRCTA